MKNALKFLTLFLIFGVLATSCTDNDDTVKEPLGDYEGGYFVLNQGNSAAVTASVSYVSELGDVSQNIFTSVNPDASLMGAYLQDMFFDGTRAFIISGQANSVTVVNRYTFEYIATVTTNFLNPRYGTVVGGKAYVTNTADWASNTDDFVTVIDLSDYSTSKIEIGNNAEKILSEDGMVYIANGYYGNGNSITVLNPTTNNIEVIDLGAGNMPNSMEGEDGSLYVLTSSGKVFEINLANNEIISTVNLPASIESPKNIAIEDNSVYLTSGTSVYSFNLGNSATISETPILTYESTSSYGVMYAFAVENDKIYIADGGNFESAGTVYLYSLNGQLLETITTGVAPCGFYFN